MKKSFFFALFISVGFQLVIGQNPINKTQHTQLRRLISKMTLKEKIGQMTQINIDVISKGEVFNLIEPHSLDSAKMYKILVEYGVGSILNAGGHAYSLEHWKEIVSTIQRFATTKNRMGIPVLYGIDAIHGANYLLNGTLFPHPLAQAATFNPGMVQKQRESLPTKPKHAELPGTFRLFLMLAGSHCGVECSKPTARMFCLHGKWGRQLSGVTNLPIQQTPGKWQPV